MATHPRVLSLCAGVGMLDLGLRLAMPGTRTVCYVEREVPAAAILAARMRDGILHEAPIWSDLTTFDARAWRGRVDLVVGGFPCQPFSCAGKREGTDDERWIWRDIARIVEECQPQAVLFENVPGLVRHGLGPVLSDLAALGFDAAWDLFRASDVGAPHKRERVFVIGVSDARRASEDGLQHAAGSGWKASSACGDGEGVADRDGGRLSIKRWSKGCPDREHSLGHKPDGCGRAGAMGNTAGERECAKPASGPSRRPTGESGGLVADCLGERLEGLVPTGAEAGPTLGGDGTEMAEPSDLGHERPREARDWRLGPADEGCELGNPDGFGRIEAELGESSICRPFPPSPGDREAWAIVPAEAQPAIRRVVDGAPTVLGVCVWRVIHEAVSEAGAMASAQGGEEGQRRYLRVLRLAREHPEASPGHRELAVLDQAALRPVPRQGAPDDGELGREIASFTTAMRDLWDAALEAEDEDLQQAMSHGAWPAQRDEEVGVVSRVDQLRACGNGVVPAVVALAWRELSTRLRGEST